MTEYLEQHGGIYREKNLFGGGVPRSKRWDWPDFNEAWKEPRTQPKREYQGEAYTEGFPAKGVTEVFVKSSNIISTAYHSIMQIMYLKFIGNSVYRYYDVPKSVFDDFLTRSHMGNLPMRISILSSDMRGVSQYKITVDFAAVRRPSLVPAVGSPTQWRCGLGGCGGGSLP